MAVLAKENIVLDADVKTKEQAIQLAGRILVERGYVEESYIEKCLREKH